MPSRTSRIRPKKAARWKVAPTCSEKELVGIATDFARELSVGHRVMLEGPMGAGKSTFARALLLGLGVKQVPEGSPTFAIVHEYDSSRGRIAHMDLYRLSSEHEIEEAGIMDILWDPERILLIEWMGNFPELALRLREQNSPEQKIWEVQIGFHEIDPTQRSVEITAHAALT